MIFAVALLVGLVVGADVNRRPRSVASARSDRPTDSRAVRIRASIERRLPSFRHVDDHTSVAVLITTVPLILIVPPAIIGGPLALVALAVRRERVQASQRAKTLTRSLPELIDQIALAVSAGLTLPAALRSVEPWLSPAMSPIVQAANARLDAGAPLVDALATIADQLPATGRRPMAVIIAATRNGAPLGPSLARSAEEARRSYKRAAETRARRLPVLMLLPLVLCVLPAFVLLTLVPLVVGSLDGLRLPGS